MAKAGVTVRVVFNRLPEIAGKLKTDGADHVQETAAAIAEDAASRAPVDTGALRDSIGASGSGLAARVTVGVPYGIYVEYGTSRAPAQPYLWPAVEAARSAYLDGWRAILSGTGRRSGSLTVLPGRGTIRRRTGGRLPR